MGAGDVAAEAGELAAIAAAAIASGAVALPDAAVAGGISVETMVTAIATATGFADSHFRYLSGLLLAIGLGFLSAVPRIERRSGRFRLLAGIVFVGGLGRLLSLASGGTPDASTVFALVMELIVAPALALWQWRVAQAAS